MTGEHIDWGAIDDDLLVSKDYTLPRFNTLYALTQAHIQDGDLGEAKKKYRQLLDLYNELSNSNTPDKDKHDSYGKLKDVYTNLQSMPAAKKKPKSLKGIVLPVSLFAIFVVVVILLKPAITGLVQLDIGNQAPEWVGATRVFTVTGLTDIKLNDYFEDPDGDDLTYLVTKAQDLDILIMDDTVVVDPNEVKGDRYVTFIASDLDKSTRVDVILEIK